MKKLIAILLCMVCVLSMAIPVFATEEEDTRTTVVSMTLDPSMESYTLTIPATISIDPTEKSATLNVTLEDVTLVWHTRLDVRYSTANGVTDQEGSFLVNTQDATKKIHYNITDSNLNVYSHDSNGETAAYYSNGEVTNAWIELEVDGEYPGAGTYTDTLTFTVEMS